MPTAGTHSAGILLRDIVMSLGIDPGGCWGPMTDRMRETTIAVLERARVRELYVLRADHLHPKCWYVLRMVATTARVRLWLVVHRERPVSAQLDMLFGCAIQWHLPPKRHARRRGLCEWPSRWSVPEPSAGSHRHSAAAAAPASRTAAVNVARSSSTDATPATSTSFAVPRYSGERPSAPSRRSSPHSTR